MLHQMAAGIVDDQRVRHAVAGHLPGGELGALVARARLVDIDVDRNAGLGGEIDRRGGGAVVDRRQPAGIAVGEDVDRLAGLLLRRDPLDDLKAVPADRAVEFDVLVGDLAGAAPGGGGAVGCRAAAQSTRRISSSAQRRLIAVGRVSCSVCQTLSSAASEGSSFIWMATP